MYILYHTTFFGKSLLIESTAVSLAHFSSELGREISPPSVGRSVKLQEQAPLAASVLGALAAVHCAIGYALHEHTTVHKTCQLHESNQLALHRVHVQRCARHW